MCVQSREERARALMFVLQICITVLFSITMTPAFLGKAPPSKHLAVSLIFQQRLSFKQPCWDTGMNFSPGRGHKCLPCWNTGSPTRAYSIHRHIHTATSRNQAVFQFCEKKNCRGLISRNEAPWCGSCDWTLPGSWHWQIAGRIILSFLSTSALWLQTTSSRYMPAKSLWIHAQLDRKMEWGGRD